MWSKDLSLMNWNKKKEELKKVDFNSIKQNIENTRLYSKCLSGGIYTETNDKENLFQNSEWIDNKTWFIGFNSSVYSSEVIIVTEDDTQLTTEDEDILSTIIDEFTATASINDIEITKDNYEKWIGYQSEGGFSQQGHFTLKRSIEENLKNVYVDLCSDKPIENIESEFNSLILDGFLVKENQKVLLKEQKTFIGLSASVDVSQFPEKYYLYKEDNVNKYYFYYNNENGIYEFKDKKLNKIKDLSYDDMRKLFINVRSGHKFFDKNFIIEKNNFGYYPLENEGIHFINSEKWIIKNQMDYNNLFETTYNDIIKHDNYTLIQDSITQSIPYRIIAVGDDGTILRLQGTYSYTLSNSFNNRNLNAISQSSKYYWIVGDFGTIIKIDKITLNIKKIEVDSFNNFKGVDFYSDLRGCVVGDQNTIYITNDSGKTWQKIEIEESDDINFKNVVYKKSNNIWISGTNGTFLELTRNLNNWSVSRKRIIIKDGEEEDLTILDNITDMKLSGSTFTLTGELKSNKEFLLLSTNLGKIIIYDVNNFSNFDFLLLKNNQKDKWIKTIELGDASIVYFSQESGLKSLDLINYDFIDVNWNILFSNTDYANILDKSPNKIRDFNLNELLFACDFSEVFWVDYTDFNTQFSISEPFLENLKNRNLFLNYDAAAKSNFYDKNGDYILPQPLYATQSLFTGATFSFNFSEFENPNYITFKKDMLKTYEYYTTFSQDNVVKFSTNFRFNNFSNIINYSTSVIDITNNIEQLAPSIMIATASRFENVGNPITIPIGVSKVWIKNYLAIFEISDPFYLNYDFQIGDVLMVESTGFKDKLIINKMVIDGASRYVYCYIEWNDQLVKHIKEEGLTLKNLNVYVNINDLMLNINEHFIGDSYKLELEGSNIKISAIKNNKTNYYNLSSTIFSSIGVIGNLVYRNSFINFGFTPTYNISSILQNIDNTRFFNSKQFISMPRYIDIPVIGTSPIESSPDHITLDDINPTNKIIFGKNLKFEFDTIWLNTFLDIIIYTEEEIDFKTDRLLVIKKYYDSNLDAYVMEFHKKINIISSTPIYMDILQRRSLSQISEDLNELNNINLNELQVEINGGTFSTFGKEVPYKYSTDSYFKILMSDRSIKEKVSNIIYTDSDNKLKVNILSLLEKIKVNIDLIEDFSGKVRINFSQEVELNNSVPIYLELENGIKGSWFIEEVIDPFSILLDLNWNNIYDSVGFFILEHRDPMLNFTPVDLSEATIDNSIKSIIEITTNNYTVDGIKHKLIDINPKKTRFKFIGGMTLSKLIEKYPWVLEGEVKDSIVGEDKNKFIFYNGYWNCGRWFGGIWYSGQWISGDWYGGEWNSNKVEFLNNSVKIEGSVDNKRSKWLSGRWFDGEWKGGTFYDGRMFNSIWNDGEWKGGVWDLGIWKGGIWSGGTWVSGEWNDGIFNRENRPSYWISGEWKGGDFQNGIWFDGEFNSKNKKSRFGTNATRSMNAIWEAGNFIDSEFYSNIRKDVNDRIVSSDIHKYSQFKTGNWSSGKLYGGIVFCANFSSSEVIGAITEDIQVIGLSFSNSINELLLNGEFEFKTGTEFDILNIGSTYSIEGRSTIISSRILGENTIIQISGNFSHFGVVNNWNIDTKLRLVSRFKNTIWRSGAWYNGIFQSGEFLGGVWYNGIFLADWGK